MSGESRPNLDGKNSDVKNTTEKNLLENVSLMTTMSPNPSQVNSLQYGGDNTQEFPNSEKFLNDIAHKLIDHGEEGFETGNSPKLGTLEERTEDLSGSSKHEALSSVLLQNRKKLGTAEIMYGFDLSPIHSTEKINSSLKPSAQKDEGNDFETKFSAKDSFRTPDSMPAKHTRSRQLRPEVSDMDEGTETLMSQVFSSADAAVRHDENHFVSSHNESSLMEKQGPASKKKLHKKPKSTITENAKQIRKKDENRLNNYQLHNNSTLRGSLITPKKHETSRKSAAVKRTAVVQADNVVAPKSPSSRQIAVKVITKSKTSTKPSSRKFVPNLKHPGETNLSKEYLKVSSGKVHHETEKSDNASDSFVLLLHNLNEMRDQLAEAKEQKDSISKERDQLSRDLKTLREENENLKKDNFVMKSRLTHFTSGQTTRKNDSVQETAFNDVAKLKHELSHQENLIKGYQKENERIYEELKKTKQLNNDMEYAMYEENLKLKMDLAKLQEVAEEQKKLEGDKHNGSAERKNDEHNRPAKRSDQKSDTEDINHLKKMVMTLENQIRAEEGLRSKAESMVKKLTDERDKAEKQLSINDIKAEQRYDSLIATHKRELETLNSELAEAKDYRFSAQKESSPLPMPPLSHFQKRIEKLESDLKSKDDLTSKAIFAVQQQHREIKEKYQECIDNLERQVDTLKVSLTGCSAELADCKKEKGHLEGWKLEQALHKLKEECESGKQERDHLVAEMSELRLKHLEALQKKGPNESLKKYIRSAEKTDHQKLQAKYNPNVFEESYISLSEKNATLKKQLESLELEFRHFSTTKEAFIVELQRRIKTQQGVHEKELSDLKQQNNSTSAENSLKGKIYELEQELAQRTNEIFGLKDRLKLASASNVREKALQKQVHQLIARLHETASNCPFESAQRIRSLEDKLRVLGEEFCIKEDMLKNILYGNSNSVLRMEHKNLRNEIERKNEEITKFRMELDSMLIVLQELQCQGVKIPLTPNLLSRF